MLDLFLGLFFLCHTFFSGRLHDFRHTFLTNGICALHDGGVPFVIARSGVELKELILALTTEIDVEIKRLAAVL